MENFNKLVETVEGLKSEAEKFFVKETNAAGTRLRKGLQEIIKASRELRKEISATKDARKEASKVDKVSE